MIAAISRIGVPIDRTVGLGLVGRVTVLIEVLAVFRFYRGRIARTIGEGGPTDSEQHGRCGHKIDDTQKLIPWLSMSRTPARERTHAPEREPSAHCGKV